MFDFGETHDKDMEIEALALDRVHESAASLLIEIFPDTAVELLSRWESRFGIVPPDSATIQERQAAVAAHERTQRKLNREYFEAIAEDLGYTIGPAGSTDPHLRFVEGDFAPFRAGFGRAGIDAVYDQVSGATTLTVKVYGTNVESDTSLQSIISNRKAGGTEFIYINE